MDMDARTPPPHAPQLLRFPDAQLASSLSTVSASAQLLQVARHTVYRTTHPHEHVAPVRHQLPHAPQPHVPPPRAIPWTLLVHACPIANHGGRRRQVEGGGPRAVQEAPEAPARGRGVPFLPTRPPIAPLRRRRPRVGVGVLLLSPSSPSPSPSEETAAHSSSAQAPRTRRGSLALLLLLHQEGTGSEAAPALAAGRQAEQQERKARRGNFWARLQQQLHHGGWHRKDDGCSVAAERQNAAAAAAVV